MDGKDEELRLRTSWNFSYILHNLHDILGPTTSVDAF